MILNDLKDVITDETEVGILVDEWKLPYIQTWKDWKESFNKEHWELKVVYITTRGFLLICLKDE